MIPSRLNGISLLTNQHTWSGWLQMPAVILTNMHLYHTGWILVAVGGVHRALLGTIQALIDNKEIQPCKLNKLYAMLPNYKQKLCSNPLKDWMVLWRTSLHLNMNTLNSLLTFQPGSSGFLCSSKGLSISWSKHWHRLASENHSIFMQWPVQKPLLH